MRTHDNLYIYKSEFLPALKKALKQYSIEDYAMDCLEGMADTAIVIFNTISKEITIVVKWQYDDGDIVGATTTIEIGSNSCSGYIGLKIESGDIIPIDCPLHIHEDTELPF